MFGVDIGIVCRACVAMMGVVVLVKLVVGKSGVDEDAEATDCAVDGRILREHRAVHRVMRDDERPTLSQY